LSGPICHCLEGTHSVSVAGLQNHHFGVRAADGRLRASLNDFLTVTKGRLEAFTDGVMAVIITVMVLELKVPHGVDVEALQPILPVFLTYVMSFVYLGIYWNNHHHMLHATDRVTGAILWANLHLLFWLSLVPFATGWMGENHFSAVPTAIYGGVMLCAGIAYYILQTTIIRAQGPGSKLARAIGSDWKGKLSPVLYAVAIPLAFSNQLLADALYITVALIWLVPDRRIERRLDREGV
jgi:TMEM175 potassium channel family protein